MYWQFVPVTSSDTTVQTVPLLTPMAPPVISNDIIANANAIFNMYKKDQTPVKSLSWHNKMLTQLACNFTADWETTARMLGLSEANVYTIRRDAMYSVKEQTVQMFQQWVMVNGSSATLGALTTALYESGAPYRNLLEVMHQCISTHIYI